MPLNLELKVQANSVVNINPDTTQNVFQVSVLQDTPQFNSQSVFIFQESDSGRFSFDNQETITLTP